MRSCVKGCAFTNDTNMRFVCGCMRVSMPKYRVMSSALPSTRASLTDASDGGGAVVVVGPVQKTYATNIVCLSGRFVPKVRGVNIGASGDKGRNRPWPCSLAHQKEMLGLH